MMIGSKELAKTQEPSWTQSGELRKIKIPLAASVYQAGENIRSVCIFLHGFGDDAANFIHVAQELSLTGTLCIALDAPMSLHHMGLANGKAWFDLFSAPWNDIEKASSLVSQSVNAILETAGVPSSKLAFVGFSQGGFMSLNMGINWPSPVAAVVSISGFLMGSHRYQDVVSHPNKKVPFFIGHGNQDQVVLPLWYYETTEMLKRIGFEKIESRIYNTAHSIEPSEMLDLKNFLKGLI